MSESLTLNLIHELKALQKEGLRGVYLSDATWEVLCQKMSVVVQTPKVEALATPAVSIPRAAPSVEVSLHLPAPAVSKPTATTSSISSLPPPPIVTLPEGDKEARRTYLRNLVLNCPICNAQVKPGKKVVFGVGNLDADIFFCGEAPGAEEEEQGEPFVGPAGQLLTKIIQAMGLSREQVYIGNIMNWRPSMPTDFGNRPPTMEEMAFCMPYLRAQLEVVQPKVVVALGATAVSGLLGADPKRKMGDARGQWHSFDRYPVMVTYHPSYLLRNATLRAKRQVWEDMLLVMEKIGIPISEKQRAFFS